METILGDLPEFTKHTLIVQVLGIIVINANTMA